MQRYTVGVTGASINFSQIFSRAYSRLLSMFINFYPKKVPAPNGWWTESNLFASWHGAEGDAEWPRRGEADPRPW